MRLKRNATLVALIFMAGMASAHHSPFLFFDPTQTVELEGVVTGVTWRNPHASYQVLAENGGGESRTWNVETNSISILRRMDLSAETVKVGDRVRVAGWPGKSSGPDMFAINMLIPSGREIVFMPGEKPRWSGEREGDTGNWLVTEDELEGPSNPEGGIFHTWSTSLAEIQEILMFDGHPFSLTETAAQARAGYDLYDSPIFEDACAHKGMPTIMEQPYPMVFADNGDVIVLTMEEGDAVREISMTPDDGSARPPRQMGYSFGEWDGDTLVVTTTGSSWPYVDMTGVPNSDDAVYVERFTPSDDGKRLDYSMTVTEPTIFTEPVVVDKYWYRIPGEEVIPYGCEPG